MTPGSRVRIIDKLSPRRGAVGTVIRTSEATTDRGGNPIPAYVFVKIDLDIFTLPWRTDQLESAE